MHTMCYLHTGVFSANEAKEIRDGSIAVHSHMLEDIRRVGYPVSHGDVM